MILSRLDARFGAPCDKCRKAVEFIRTLSADTPVGKIVIDGDNMYANVMEYDTALDKADSLEAHEKYVDVQAVLAGSEAMAWADIQGLAETAAYSAEKDVKFVKAPEVVSRIELFPGLFAIFFPDDGHYGKLKSVSGAGKIRKVVVKIKL